jgi:DNA repair protein SbcC/Rad50
MRPLRLDIEGFSTFRDRATVDFTDIDVVALVGPTGSGKSTIIDAITFALYGSVARYDDKGIVAPVINQLSTEAKVRLDFQAGGKAYSAVRIVRRTKTGASTKEARLESDGEVLAGDPRGLDAAIRDLLGLDFERFNKTVVLPQGKFATFLHDKPADRQQLLRELLGLGVYERLGRQARQQAAVADNQLSILEPQLAIDEDLSDERRAALQEALDRAGTVREYLATAATEVDELNGELAQLDQTLERLRVEQGLLATVSIPEGISVLAAELSASTSNAKGAEAEQAAARDHRRQCERALKGGPDIARCETLIGQYEAAAELASLLEALGVTHREAIAANAVATADVEQFREQVRVCREAVDSTRADRDLAAATLAELPDLAFLEAHVADHHRRAELSEAVCKAEKSVEQVSERHESALVEADIADKHHRHLIDLAPAVALRSLLAVGEPCPVCDQAVHQLPAREDPSNQHSTSLAAAQSVAESARQQLQLALADKTRADATFAASRHELATVERRLVNAQDLPQTQKLAKSVVLRRDRLSDAQDLAAAAERQLRATEDDPNLALAMAALTQTTGLISSTAASLDAYTEQQRRIDVALRAAPDLATLTIELTTAHQLADDLDLASRAEADADQRLEAAQAALAGVSQQATVARAEYARVRDRLATLHPAEPTGDLHQDWTSLNEWAAETHEKNAARAIEVAQHRQQLADQLGAITDSAVAVCTEFVAQPASELVGLREQMATATQRLRSDIERFSERHKHFAALNEQANGLREGREVATMVGNLLRSDGFEKWLLQEVLTDLVARATVRLKELSGGQFSLVALDGSFSICDHRNADEIRDARTLSGGETFLASLSLALALADASADLAVEGSAPLESIFLDEGFGTLDPDTLDIVASTLEELGAAGRMVGVVTHIRELAERMPIRLEVSKGPLTSTVTRVEV